MTDSERQQLISNVEEWLQDIYDNFGVEQLSVLGHDDSLALANKGSMAMEAFNYADKQFNVLSEMWKEHLEMRRQLVEAQAIAIQAQSEVIKLQGALLESKDQQTQQFQNSVTDSVV